MSLTLNFIESDSESSITQDPKVVTTNNREVSLKSVIQQPIESGSSVDTTIASRSNVSSIDYIEIGTIINIHPKIVDDYMGAAGDKAVQLNVSLVVSSEIGKQVIDRKEFPVISSRTYNYTVIVPTGRTLAIGGLSESQETNIEKKIPLLGDLPIIGAAFRNKSEIKKKRNLVAFITPTILG
jgi:type II secretory pathway component GspD/PulD (secretin)